MAEPDDAAPPPRALALLSGPDTSRAVLAAARAWADAAGGMVDARKVASSEMQTPEHVGAALADAVRQSGAQLLIGPADALGQDALARAAALLDWPMVSRALSVRAEKDRRAEKADIVWTRAAYAGSLIASVALDGGGGVVSIVPTEWKHGPPEKDAPTGRPLAMSGAARVPSARLVSVSPPASTRPSLQMARVVVTGGRPLGDDFERLAGGLADALGGAVGATGGAVGAGLADGSLLIGQTGATVAPDVYIGAAVSGSDQHVAGMRGSRLIVCINTDPDAPLFAVSDLGLVADAREALAALREQVISQ